MDSVPQISEFGKILIFLIAGIIMVCIAFAINRVLAPNNPNPEKLTSYECGEEPTGSAWMPFNSRFYVIALIFLLFDVEMVFIFPWATVFGSREIEKYDARWGGLSFIEMFIFLGVLVFGLIYVWAKGDLDWMKPTPSVPVSDSRVPPSLYDKLNAEQSAYMLKEFELATSPSPAAAAPANAEPTPASPPIRKPMFKPTFKKPGNEQ